MRPTAIESQYRRSSQGLAFEVSYVAVDGKPVKHDVSLDQFTQAYEFFTANLAKTN